MWLSRGETGFRGRGGAVSGKDNNTEGFRHQSPYSEDRYSGNPGWTLPIHDDRQPWRTPQDPYHSNFHAGPSQPRNMGFPDSYPHRGGRSYGPNSRREAHPPPFRSHSTERGHHPNPRGRNSTHWKQPRAPWPQPSDTPRFSCPAQPTTTQGLSSHQMYYQNYKGSSASRGRPTWRGHWSQVVPPGAKRGTAKQRLKEKRLKKLREADEEMKFYCDVCDKGFKTDEKLQEHIDTHVKCSHTKCTYIACPKMIQMHDKFQHQTGLFEKIWNQKSRAAVEKWRADRKLNFPTAANMKKKKHILAARVARGEVLETQTFSKMSERRRLNGNRLSNNGRLADNIREKYRLKNRAHRRRPLRKPTLLQPFSEQSDVADPLASLIEGSEHELGAEEEEEEQPENQEEVSELAQTVTSPQKSQQQLSGGLNSLLCAYGDNSSESEGKSDSEPDLVLPPAPAKPRTPPRAQPSHHTTDSTSSVVEKEGKLGKRKKRKRNRAKQRSGDSAGAEDESETGHPADEASPRKRKPTLLQMLLAPDIRHERNVILQCVRHVLKQNFYGIGPSSVSASKSSITEDDESKSEEGNHTGQERSVEKSWKRTQEMNPSTSRTEEESNRTDCTVANYNEKRSLSRDDMEETWEYVPNEFS